jgi:hypothetical protein
MTDITNNSISVSDDTIRRFLLGQLTVAEQPIFEQRLFTDEALEARVRMNELALTDDYVRGRLTVQDHDRFKEFFLLTADRDRILTVSQALNDRFAAAPRTHATLNLRTLFNLERSAWRYAFAALLLLFVLATFWLGVKEPQLVKRILTPGRIAPRPSPTQTPQVTHHSITPSAPAHAEQTPALPPHEVSAPVVVLDQNNTKDNLAIVSLPKNRSYVRVELLLNQSGADTFRAELWNSTGQSLFSADALVATNGKVTLNIPASVLPAGAYEINLSRMKDGATENVAAYFFRVQ